MPDFPVTYPQTTVYPKGHGETDEVQKVTKSGTVSGGTFTLTFDGETTAAIAFDAPAADVQTALENLVNIHPGDVEVTGGPVSTTALTFTFGDNYAGENVPQIVSDDASITGGGTLVDSTTTAGAGGAAQYDVQIPDNPNADARNADSHRADQSPNQIKP